MRGEVIGPLGESAFEIGFHGAHLVAHHRPEEIHLGIEMGVERLLAHAQLGREIVHRYPAETMGEKVTASAGDDAPLDGFARSGSHLSRCFGWRVADRHNLWKLT